MKTHRFEDKDTWLSARRGKITGSRLKDIIIKRGTTPKIGYYELIAEKIAIEPDKGQSPLERGVLLESEALVRFATDTKKKVDTSLVIWTRDDNENIGISPDGFIGKTEAVEVKCLSSANHIKAWLTQEVPSEYEEQVIQYFIVNEKLKTLYFAFYDPRIPSKDFFYLTIKRKDVQEKAEQYLEYQRKVLEEVNQIVINLTF